MIDYVENLNRIVGVAWENEELTAKVTISPGFLNDIIFGVFNELGQVVGPGGDPTQWQAIITGVDSGAQVDLRNIPHTAFSFFGNPQPTACDDTPTNHWVVPSGVPVTDANMPTIQGMINGNTTVNFARIASIRTLRPVGSLCVFDQGPVALPAFINGEAITLSAE